MNSHEKHIAILETCLEETRNREGILANKVQHLSHKVDSLSKEKVELVNMLKELEPILEERKEWISQKKELEIRIKQKQREYDIVAQECKKLSQIQPLNAIPALKIDDDVRMTLQQSLNDTTQQLIQCREKLKALEIQVSDNKTMGDKVSKLAQENNQLKANQDPMRKELDLLKQEQQIWKEFTLQTGTLPKDMAKSLAILEIEKQDLLEKVENLHEKLIKADAATFELEKRNASVVQDYEALRSHISELENRQLVMKNNSGLLMKEIDMLHDQLLETLVNELREGIMTTNSSTVTISNPFNQELEDKLSQVKSDLELKQLECAELLKHQSLLLKENASMEKELGLLQQSVGSGRYDSKEYRVLQLANNPTSNHPSRIETEEMNLPNEALLSLKKQLEEKDIKIDRLKLMFGQKANELRHMTLATLGYQLDILPMNRIKASSIFSVATYFIISVPSKDCVTIIDKAIEADYAREIEQQFLFWIGERKCVPAFLASVTLLIVDKIRSDRKRKKMA